MCAEFNFACDPEAAYIVLNDYLCPTYIASWEFTCRSKLPWVSEFLFMYLFIFPLLSLSVDYFMLNVFI